MKQTALPRITISIALFITAVPAASMAQSTGSVLPVPGIERATTRADTMRNAIAIHDEISRRVCGRAAEATSSLTREQACPEPVSDRKRLIHFYWTWLIRLLFCLGAVVVACLALTPYRASIGFLPLAISVAVLALLDTGNLLADEWSGARSTEEKVERAEWQWRLDLAKASSMRGDEGGMAALEAVQRYAAAVSMR